MKPKNNPFSPWKDLFLWMDWNNLKKLHRFFNSGGVTEIGDFERDTLIPGAINRLEHFRHLFQRIKKTCADQYVAQDLDTTLRNVLPPHFKGITLPAPKVGQQYLDTIDKMVDSDFISSIDDILRKYSKRDAINDVHELIAFLNQVKYLCSSVQQTKASLFYFSFRSFPIVRRVDTGEEIVGLPIDLKIIILPFQIVLDELVSASGTLEASIDEWSRKRQDARKEFIGFLTARSQLSANNRMLAFQIAVIVFTVCLSSLFLLLNDPFSLHKQNEELKTKLNAIEAERSSMKSELLTLQQSLNNLKPRKPRTHH